MARSMGGRDCTMLVARSVLCGSSHFANGVAVPELPPLALVWLRVAVEAGTRLLVLRISGQPMPAGQALWAAFFGIGRSVQCVGLCLHPPHPGRGWGNQHFTRDVFHACQRHPDWRLRAA